MSYRIEVYEAGIPHEWAIPALKFFAELAKDSACKYKEFGFNWKNFDLYGYSKIGRIVVCRKDGEFVGVMLSRVFESIFDYNSNILYQDLLWARPGTRAAHLLMEEFVDFGKKNANMIISCIGQKTNIKGRTLEKRGFVKMETLYRIKV